MVRLYPDAFAVCVCLLMLANTLSPGKKRGPDERLLLTMVFFELGLLVLHAGGVLLRELGGPAVAAALQAVCFLSGLLYVAAFSAAWLFADVQMRGCRGGSGRMLELLLPDAAVLLLLLLNFPAGWFYRLDAASRLRVRPLAWVLCLPFLLLLAVAATRFLVNLRHFDRNRAFAVGPLLGLLLAGQCVLPLPGGYSASILLLALTALVAFCYLQNRVQNIDYLTGLYNRAQVDRYIRSKILRCAPGRTFSCIMIDLDNFKEINDRFGHTIGDEALETAARLMKSSLRRGDFLARIGGDEFLVVLDEGSYENLSKAAERIREAFERFNSRTVRAFRLSLSMGYDVYRYGSHMTWSRFYRRIDRLMYENKKTRKQELAAGGAPLE